MCFEVLLELCQRSGRTETHVAEASQRAKFVKTSTTPPETCDQSPDPERPAPRVQAREVLKPESGPGKTRNQSPDPGRPATRVQTREDLQPEESGPGKSCNQKSPDPGSPAIRRVRMRMSPSWDPRHAA
ncbi:unnamed protein product [Merluccius merluccius]